jgi:4-aminobutyrate aminotransferase
MKTSTPLRGPSINTALPGPRSQELIAVSQQYEPGAASEQVPIVWKSAEGVWVTDMDDNTFLDFTSGVLVANAGHSHPRLVRAMQEQAENAVNTYDFLNEWRPQLAKKLVEITPPNLSRAIVLSTGAETIETAMKIARLYTGKHEIVAFHGAFHGRTYGAMSVNGKRSSPGIKGFGPFLPGVVFAPFPYPYRSILCRGHEDECSERCFEYFKWIIETESEKDIAAVLVETYQGAAGSIIAPKDWLQNIAQWCKDNGALLIIDEVQASFGRTGRLFGFEHYDIEPNLLCLGKGISSTVPVSAVVGEEDIMNSLTPGSVSSTHGGNAFSSRVALENINVILEENLSENAARVGAVLDARFRDMQRKYPIIGDVRGLGMVFGLEMVKDPESREPDPDITHAIIDAAFQRGIVMIAPIGFYGNVIRIAPPLVITEDEALLGADILEEAIASVVG